MALLTRFDPWRELARMQEDLGRAFDDRMAFRGGESLGWTPRTDIYEDGEALTLRFELAGVDPKDVDIRFENGTLTLKGDRKLDREDLRDNYHRIELEYGAFNRSFSLPTTVDPDHIRAESRNGILVVTLTKRPEAKPKTIQVKVK